MSAACPACNGTGSLLKQLWGNLDCTHCGVAEERVAYNAWQRKTLTDPDAPAYDDGWVIYQAGKAAALEQAAKLQRYEYESDYEGDHYMCPDPMGDYVKIEDIRRIKP